MKVVLEFGDREYQLVKELIELVRKLKKVNRIKLDIEDTKKREILNELFKEWGKFIKIDKQLEGKV